MGEKSEASAGTGGADASASEETDGETSGESEDRDQPRTSDGIETGPDAASESESDAESSHGAESESDVESDAESATGTDDGAADDDAVGDGAADDDRSGDDDRFGGESGAAGGIAPPDGRVAGEEFGPSDGMGASRRGIPPSGRPGEPEESEPSSDARDEATESGAAPGPDLVASEFVAPNPDAADVAATTAARADGEEAAPYDPPRNVRELVGDSFSPPEAVEEEPDVRDPYEETEAESHDGYRDGFSYEDDERETLAGSELDRELSRNPELDDETADEFDRETDEFREDTADGFGDGTVNEFDDGILGDGPESDQEMPLADHIEEMVQRLAVVFVIGIGATLIAFPFADQLINTLWNTHIPGAPANPDRRPRLFGPLELILTELKVAGLAGFILGLPMFVYQTYRFMRPGLYPRERRYYLAAVPTSLVLALVGVAFSHFVVLPVIFAYFTSYTEGTAVVAFGLRETFRLILLLMGYMAVVFQIPLFIMLAIMMGLVTRQWLTEKRLLFWGGFAGVSFLISPDPTGMAPIIIAATMISLFEGTLALLRWTGN